MGTYIIVVIYFAVIGFLGWKGYRGTKTDLDYMVAGRNVHPYVMAMSYGATFISTSAIVGFGGAAGVFGMGLLWLTFLNIFVGIFLAFVVFGGRTRQMGHHLDAHTFPELMGLRYRSRFIQGFSGLVIFLFMPLYTAAVLIGAAQFIATKFAINYEVALFGFATIVAIYVIMGGLKGVMYTDALQGSIMLIGMAILLIITYRLLGGVTEAHTSLAELSDKVPPPLKAGGHQGWTSMPAFGTPFWWMLVSTIIMGVGIGVLAMPQLAVRYMTVRSKRELNRAVLVGGIFVLAMTGVAFVVGSLSNVYFFRTTGKISIAAAQGDVSRIIPEYIKAAMPSWFGLLFLLTLLAAAMSTISSQFHAMGTSIGRDFYEKGLRGGKNTSGSIGVTRIGILAAIILSVFLGYWLQQNYGKQGMSIIARGTAIFFGLCASTFLPMYFGGLFTRRITRAGAIAGMLVGFASSVFWLGFVLKIKGKMPALLAQACFGKDSILDGSQTGFILWDQVDPLFIAFPLAVIVTILVSFLTKPMPKEHIDHCFQDINN
ncbi:MAG: sodium:solute symporter family protein [Candidatus Erginobacter occultus]|nr:sodium:solute symporter family protein [Candidatus Erginobacter occultus]